MIRGHRRVAVDTAPLIYFLQGDGRRAPIVRALLRDAAERRVSLVVSVITEAELLVGPLRSSDPMSATAVRALLDGEAGIEVIGVTRAIAQEAALLRSELGLTLADAIVAATAGAAECTALLGNDTAFRRLRDEMTYLHVDDLAGSR